MRIVSAGQLTTDAWELAGDAVEILPACAIVRLPRWHQVSPVSGRSPFGLLLTGDDERSAILAALPRCPLVAIEFASFGDGRGYSLACLVRDAGYVGDLRAVGDILRDQVFFLTRCGFSSLAPAAHVDGEDFVRGLRDFSAVYQPAADQRPTVAQLRWAR